MAAPSSSCFSNLIDCPVLGYSIWDRHFFAQENYLEVIPALEPLNDSLSPISPTGTEQSHNGIQGCGDDTSVESSEVGEVTIISKRGGRRKRPVPSTLSKEIISNYFHMPLDQAAEELGIGETALKGRCRKVGIPRWPYRKLKSLETLMKSVQDFEEDPEDAVTKAAVRVLKNKHKLLSDMPGLEWDPETLCLRKAYFKLNYMKKKLIKMTRPPSPSISSSYSTPPSATVIDTEDMDIPLIRLLRPRRLKADCVPYNLATPAYQQGAEETDRVTSESTSSGQIPMDYVYLESAVNLSALAGVGYLLIPTLPSVTGEIEN